MEPSFNASQFKFFLDLKFSFNVPKSIISVLNIIYLRYSSVSFELLEDVTPFNLVEYY
jgi:hypothetical protein